MPRVGTVAPGMPSSWQTLVAVGVLLSLGAGLVGLSLWRKHCEAGEDTDYYKKPVFLTPVKEGPFYALKVGPALLTVTGGLKTDINFECLDADGKPIEGLYALGNCMGDITAVDYPINVAGNSHGRCITYGYLLGKDLAK